LLSEGERPSLFLTRFGIVTLSILSQLLFVQRGRLSDLLRVIFQFFPSCCSS